MAALTTRACSCVAETSRNPYRMDQRAEPDCPLCLGNGELRIRSTFDPPPIPIRTSDWQALLDGDEESGAGYGLTQTDAINNLMDRLEVL